MVKVAEFPSQALPEAAQSLIPSYAEHPEEKKRQLLRVAQQLQETAHDPEVAVDSLARGGGGGRHGGLILHVQLTNPRPQ